MSSVIFDPDDPTVAIVGDATEASFGVHVGATTIHNVHDAAKCAGRGCVIHHPSDHHMRAWPLTWRDDKGVMERRCPHGTGHPDPDDATYLRSIGDGALLNHGCDGCCRCACQPRFDGRYVRTGPNNRQEYRLVLVHKDDCPEEGHHDG